MTKAPKNHGQEWTSADEAKLRQLARGNTPTGLMGYELGRTADAVRSHASAMGLSLNPSNRSPYTRRDGK